MSHVQIWGLGWQIFFRLQTCLNYKTIGMGPSQIVFKPNVSLLISFLINARLHWHAQVRKECAPDKIKLFSFLPKLQFR